MNAVLEFASANAALLVSIVALLISLRASYTSHQVYKLNLKTKANAGRVTLFEKKHELLNELDRQHSRIATLKMLIAQKILLFRKKPDLHDSMSEEFDRLKSNLNAMKVLDSKYEEQRGGIEAINVGADIAKQDELLANIRRLTIHIEKDISHEQSHFEELRSKVRLERGA